MNLKYHLQRYYKAIAAAVGVAATPVLTELVADLSQLVTVTLTAVVSTILVALSPKNREKEEELGS